ncbi:MAG: alpha/beta hydrolase family protein [Candidatus Woesearchaeota archaeon]
MHEQEHTITNRQQLRVVLTTNICKNQQGLAFITHGLGGFQDQEHIQAIKQAFLENNISTVTFDTTHSFGRSEGSYKEATATKSQEDLEDVISWAKKQSFYEEPYFLAGHSLGGLSSLVHTQKHPTRVRAIAPISAVTNGKKSQEQRGEEVLANWKKTGYLTQPSKSKPGVIKKLCYEPFNSDMLGQNTLQQAHTMKCPVLLIVGENDSGTPQEDQQELYDKLQTNKKLHVIKQAPHTFREEKHLQELKEVISNWLKEITRT